MGARDAKQPETLPERFWSLARGMEGSSRNTDDPVAVVEHVLAVLDALEAGKVGDDLTANTINFLALLRQYEVKGDLLYASPEQARGEQVDERSLVFSVGVLLFEKLTGRHPFGVEGNPQRVARIRRGEMASGVNFFPMVPAELRVVLVKAMGPFPEERWTSLAEMRVQLEMFVDKARHPEDYSGPRAAQPLPGAGFAEEQTLILNRRAPAVGSAAELERLARATSRQSAIRLDTQPVADAGDPDEPTDRARFRARQRIAGPGLLVGIVIGAAAASVVFAMGHHSSKKSAGADRSAEVASAAEPGDGSGAGQAASAAPAAATPSETAAATPSETAAAKPAAAAAKPATATPSKPATATPSKPAAATPTPSVRPARQVPTATPSGTFDIHVGGQQAMAAVHQCIAADRTVQFGASLIYDGKTGRSRRIYFDGLGELHPDERECLGKKLLGLTAGGMPPRTQGVTYSFWLGPDRNQVKSHLDKN